MGIIIVLTLMDRLIKNITGGNIRVDFYENLLFPQSETNTRDKEESVYEDEEDVSPKFQFPLNWTKLNYPCVQNDGDVLSKNLNTLLNDKLFASFCKKLYNKNKKLNLNGYELYLKTGKRLSNSYLPALLNFLMRNKDIISVDLAYNQIDSEGFKTIIHHLLVNHNITELNLEHNNIETRGIDYLFEVKGDLPLICLKLNGNKLGTEGSKKIALLLLKNSKLKHLDVAETDQTASSLVYFITVLRSDQHLYNNNLRILDISRPNPNPMYSFNSEHIASRIGAMLKYNSCLFELHLQKFGFDCHDIEAMMEEAKYNNTLRLLDLSNNNIGDHGVENVVTWLAKRPALKALILARNIISDHGASSLSRNIPYSRLILLDVSYNKITDDGMTNVLYTLKKCPPIEYLRIFGNNISHPTAKIIQRMLASEVLKQEHIDVKPYRVDHKWCIAHYSTNDYKERYYNAFCYPRIKSLKDSNIIKLKEKLGLPYSYMDAKISESLNIQKDAFICKCDLQSTEALKESIFKSNTTIETISSNKCTCQFELIEEDITKNTDLSSSVKSNELQENSECKFDIKGRISFILNRVTPDTKRDILRWINMNEVILKEDLEEREVLPESSEDKVEDLCHCSWTRFTLTACSLVLKE